MTSAYSVATHTNVNKMNKYHQRNLTDAYYVKRTYKAPVFVNELTLYPSIIAEQRILRQLISIDGGETQQFNTDLLWALPAINMAVDNQVKLRSSNPFVYVTVRRGVATSTHDCEWHVDGYSKRIPHRPEDNYVWCDSYPMQAWVGKLYVPSSFDGLRHNINWLFQDQIAKSVGDHIVVTEANALYWFNPYIVHRRNPQATGQFRTMVRVSFTPVPIMDKNNTPPITDFNFRSTRDGRLLQNKLERWVP